MFLNFLIMRFPSFQPDVFYFCFQTCWDIMVLVATIYVAVSVPMNASFHGNTCCYENITYQTVLDGQEHMHEINNVNELYDASYINSNLSSAYSKHSSTHTTANKIIFSVQKQNGQDNLAMNLPFNTSLRPKNSHTIRRSKRYLVPEKNDSFEGAELMVKYCSPYSL